jgi:hypothetical protein
MINVISLHSHSYTLFVSISNIAGNLMLPFVTPPPVLDDKRYAWFVAPSADGKRLMIIRTVNHIGIAHGEVPPDILYAANGLQLWSMSFFNILQN